MKRLIIEKATNDKVITTEIFKDENEIANLYNEIVEGIKQRVDNSYTKTKRGKNYIEWSNDKKTIIIRVVEDYEYGAEVYCVLEDWVVDFDSSESPNVEVFYSYHKALECYLQKVKDARTDAESWGDDIDEYDTGKNKYFSISESGYWSKNHIAVQLVAKEI